MKRRKILAVPGAVVAANLVGCGGGGEVGAPSAAGSAASSGNTSAVETQLNAFLTIPLVPEQGIYWAEITTHQRDVTVFVTPQGQNFTDLVEVRPDSSQTGPQGPTRLAWIDLRSANLNTLAISAQLSLAGGSQGLWVNGTSYQTLVPGQQAGPILSGFPQKGATLKWYTDVAEYVYKFVDGSNNPYAIVRFYPYDSRFGAMPTFPSSSRVINIDNNFSISDFGSSGTRKLISAPRRVLAKAQDPSPSYRLLVYDTPNSINSGFNDAISYPDRGDASIQAIHKPLLAVTDPNHRVLLKHRIWKHFLHITQSYFGSPYSTAQQQSNIGQGLINEVYQSIGGNHMSDGLLQMANTVATAAKNSVSGTASALESWFSSTAGNLADVPSGRDLGEQIVPGLDGKLQTLLGLVSDVGGGAGVSISAQVGGKITFPAWTFPLKGARFSFGLYRSSYTGVILNGTTHSSYGVFNNEGKYKLGITGIIPAGQVDIFGNNFSADVELNFNVTIFNGVWRLDSIQLDPVFDADTRGWIWNHIVSPSIDALSKNAALQSGVAKSASALVKMASVMNTAFAGAAAVSLATTHPGQAAAAFRSIKEGGELGGAAVSAITKAAGSFLWTTPWRAWATFELSPCRITLPNSDLADPNQSFRAGYRIPYDSVSDLIGWTPGVKYITGPGIEWELVEVGKVFVRTVACFDGFLIVGSDNWRKAMSFWDFSGGD